MIAADALMGRIIPARAGFTPRARSGSGSRWDHPRSRGVYPGSSGLGGCASGSSPLARGLQLTDLLLNPLERIIPARAGFTAYQWARLARRADHPRSRGVYAAQGQHLPIQGGSSPLARGLRNPYQRVLPAAGIIPARAGFTAQQAGYPTGGADHPRSRGVYLYLSKQLVSCVGSSPLARGLRADQDEGGRARPDHPRSRGVYFMMRERIHSSAGSSPLARGLRVEPHLRLLQSRIIPARAGFTQTEKAMFRSVAGSSPLARGLLGQGPAHQERGGIIPARAGFTRSPQH